MSVRDEGVVRMNTRRHDSSGTHKLLSGVSTVCGSQVWRGGGAGAGGLIWEMGQRGMPPQNTEFEFSTQEVTRGVHSEHRLYETGACRPGDPGQNLPEPHFHSNGKASVKYR